MQTHPTLLQLCTWAAATLAVSATAAPARADVLLIDRVRATSEQDLPKRGMTMAQVEARFGAPLEKRPPVGGGRPQQPPITRWIYPGFSVYFERERVIDAVLAHSTAHETTPKPVLGQQPVQ